MLMTSGTMSLMVVEQAELLQWNGSAPTAVAARDTPSSGFAAVPKKWGHRAGCRQHIRATMVVDGCIDESSRTAGSAAP
jgi:hypothetical protein